jgi:lipopolysaccharide export system protein LptA
MPVNVSRLRIWFAVALTAAILAVMGFYLYARLHARFAIAELPKKLGVEIQQSTQGFTLSRSERGHTLYTIQAARMTQFKQSGVAQLEDVSVVVYGREANRFDRIQGKSFEYDPRSGEVTAKGEVNIDLQANPAGPERDDQADPQVLREPVRVVTSGLVFNAKTGNAETRERVEFHIARGSGYADGASYDSKENRLLLEGNVHLTVAGDHPMVVVGQSGVLSKQPSQAVLYSARIERDATVTDANQLTLFFRPDQSIERVVAAGDVKSVMRGESVITLRAPQGTFYLVGSSNQLTYGDLTGGTTIESVGASQASGAADQTRVLFAERDLARKIEARGNVRLVQEAAEGQATRGPVAGMSGAQKTELYSDAMDFWVQAGKNLDWAETLGAGRMLITHAPPAVIPPPKQLRNGEWVKWRPATTEVKADHLLARFGASGRIATMHGDRSHVWYESYDQPVRETRSRDLDVAFGPDGQIASMTQKGQFYSAEYPCMAAANCQAPAQRQAWADTAAYTPSTGVVVLTGTPRVIDGGMTTLARRITMNRESGETTAEQDVKTTYNDLKPQPDGALLASSDPIHVSSRRMTAERGAGLAHYEGDARLWQGSSIIEAEKIHFDRNQRTVVAEASPAGGWRKLVHTIFAHQEKDGRQVPVQVTSRHLDYADTQRLARFDGTVLVRAAEGTTRSDHADVYLRPREAGPAPASRSVTADLQNGQIDHVVATGSVHLQQPGRQAWGDRLVYTDARDEFVLTGKAPHVLDAERGNIWGDSLTFYNRDDRVLVEGTPAHRARTETRVSK